MKTDVQAVEPQVLGSASIDERGDIAAIDERLADVLGWPAPLLHGRSFTVVLDPRDAPLHQAHLDWSLRTGGEQEYETRLRIASREFVAAHVRLHRTAGASPHVIATVTGATGAIAPGSDASERRSTADGSSYAVVSVRIDRLAHIDHDVLPQAIRTGVAQAVSERLAAHTRSDDMVTLSADREFVISLVDVRAPVDGHAAARRFARIASAPVITPVGPVRPLVSTRIAFFDATHAA